MIIDLSRPKIKTIQSNILLLLIAVFINACPQESDHLVNPPSQAERVLVRYINLAGDGEANELVLGGEKNSGVVNYGETSILFNPPSDSSFVTVNKNNVPVLSPERRFRFTRDITYTFFSLPSIPGDSLHPRDVDTLMFFNTNLTVPDVTNNAYVRLLNAVPDPSRSYSLVQGCANGIPIASNLPYRRFNFSAEILSGRTNVSLVRIENGESFDLGLYSVLLEAGGEYAFIVTLDDSGNEKLLLLDENNPTVNALIEPEVEEDKTTNLRILNFTESTIDIYKNDNEVVSGFQSKYISNYLQLQSCGGAALDRFSVLINGDTSSTTFTSLNVLQNNSMMVFPGRNLGETFSIIKQPFRLFVDTEGKSVIRVLNAHPDYEGINVAFGARKSITTNISNEEIVRIASGENLASELIYGEFSTPRVVEPGIAPVTFFTSTQPSEFISGVNFDLEGDKNYTFVLYKDELGESKVVIISDDEIEKNIEPLEDGIFFQFVNGIPGLDYIKLDLPPILSSDFAQVFYGLNIATIIPKTANSISINGKQFNINPEIDKRLLVVATGNKDNIDIIESVNEPIKAGDREYRIRFINASEEQTGLTISNQDLRQNPDFPVLIGSLFYKQVTVPISLESEAKFSLYVLKTGEYEELVHRVDDIKLNFKKSYSIVFIGDSSLGFPDDDDDTNNGYSVVIIQEY